MAADWYTESEQEMDNRDAAIAQTQLEERHRMEEEQKAFLKQIRKIQQESAQRFAQELEK